MAGVCDIYIDYNDGYYIGISPVTIAPSAQKSLQFIKNLEP